MSLIAQVADTFSSVVLDRWRLHLFGEFRLISPKGIQVKLPTRKVEGLIAVLALNREYGIARDDLAEILWQESSVENQRASLRQALTQLRRLIGDESVETSRTHARLADRFSIDCDYDQNDLRDSSGFMPSQEGEWFEHFRLETTASPLVADRKTSPTLVQNFLESLQWLSTFDPRGMYSLLRSNQSMGHGIHYPELRALVEKPIQDESLQGWSAYWKATVDDNLLVSANLLRSALQFAKRNEDLELALSVCAELGKTYSRTGELSKADKICTLADNVADMLKTRQAKAVAARLRGTHLINWANTDEGLKHLERAEHLTDDPVARTHIRVVQAWFAASTGKTGLASALLEENRPIAPRFGHGGIDLVTEMTHALLTLEGCRPFEMVKEFERISVKAYTGNVIQFGVYADEVLAKLLYLDRDKGLAQQKMQAAKKARSTVQMVMTEVEAKRLLIVR